MLIRSIPKIDIIDIISEKLHLSFTLKISSKDKFLFLTPSKTHFLLTILFVKVL